MQSVCRVTSVDLPQISRGGGGGADPDAAHGHAWLARSTRTHKTTYTFEHLLFTPSNTSVCKLLKSIPFVGKRKRAMPLWASPKGPERENPAAATAPMQMPYMGMPEQHSLLKTIFSHPVKLAWASYKLLTSILFIGKRRRAMPLWASPKGPQRETPRRQRVDADAIHGHARTTFTLKDHIFTPSKTTGTGLIIRNRLLHIGLLIFR